MPDRGFAETGRLWLRGALSEADTSALKAASEAPARPGLRLSIKALSAPLAPVTAALEAHWPGMFPVRLVVFDKRPEANWGVPWHQDRVIAVARKAEAEGVTNWSQKAGIWHCEPPSEVLEAMLFLRVHLDACNAENGAMEIACGSHRFGKVPSAEAADRAEACDTEICEADAGDILVLHMLTLHRSRPAQAAAPRATLRLDYANSLPPPPLSWAETD